MSAFTNNSAFGTPFQGGGVVTDYQNFYEFGDSGLDYTKDTAKNQDLTDSNTTQVDDPVQGFVAELTASPTDQGFTNMGVVVGSVDKSMAFVFKFNVTNNILFLKEGINTNYLHIASANVIRVVANGLIYNFDVPAMSVATFYHAIVTINSSDQAHVYLNNLESTTGVQTVVGDWDMDAIGNYPNTSFDWLGAVGKVRIYPRILTSDERELIFTTDLKVS